MLGLTSFVRRELWDHQALVSFSPAQKPVYLCPTQEKGPCLLLSCPNSHVELFSKNSLLEMRGSYKGNGDHGLRAQSCDVWNVSPYSSDLAFKNL